MFVDQKFVQKLEAKQPEGEISVYCNENENFLISKNEHCTQVYCQKSKQNKTHTNNIENKNIRKIEMHIANLYGIQND